jgi:hypothetical protein
MRICPRCQNTNPDEAAYCYFDGFSLHEPGSVPALSRLPHDFVFPSGRHCRTYEELALGCHEEWDTARGLLKEGAFRHFLTAAGRLDLARAADEAVANADADIALDTFLVKLPVTGLPAPRLELEPRRLILGTMRTGETLDAELRVVNLGKGLLLGTLAVAGGDDWLRLDGAIGGTVKIKAVRDQKVALRIDTSKLSAPRDHGAHLTVISNGGIVEVPVRLSVAAHPFAHAPYKGAGTPRDLAVRMRTNPKPAVALLESGEVARWFQLNAWPYPVNGPTAAGMAAVQQFFESMGLARPPTLSLSESALHFICTPPESAVGQATFQAAERKWVYGRLSCDAAWVRLPSSVFSGPQKADLSFEIDSSRLPPGHHETTVQVIGNAGKTMSLRISVEVLRPATALSSAALSSAALSPAPLSPAPLSPMPLLTALSPAPRPPLELPSQPSSLGRAVLKGALLGMVLRLFLAGPADLYARVFAVGPGKPLPGTFAAWREAPVDAAFVKHFVIATWWLGAVAGAVVLARRRSHWADVPCGLIAGAAAGMVVSGTVACLLPALDGPARLIWQPVAAAGSSARGPGAVFAGTMGWLAVAVLSWAVLGALTGFVVRWLRGLVS